MWVSEAEMAVWRPGGHRGKEGRRPNPELEWVEAWTPAKTEWPDNYLEPGSQLPSAKTEQNETILRVFLLLLMFLKTCFCSCEIVS